MLPNPAIRQNAPYEVREVTVSAEEADRLPTYGPHYNVFDKHARPLFRDPLTWSDAAMEAAKLNES
jgi:hypothetical protein